MVVWISCWVRKWNEDEEGGGDFGQMFLARGLYDNGLLLYDIWRRCYTLSYLNGPKENRETQATGFTKNVIFSPLRYRSFSLQQNSHTMFHINPTSHSRTSSSPNPILARCAQS